MNSHLPSGYILRASFPLSTKRVTEYASLTVLIASGFFFLLVNNLVRHDFDSFGCLTALFSSPSMSGGMVAILAVLAYIIVHEGIHGILFLVFTHRRPHFIIKSLSPATLLPSGTFISRNKAIVAALSPFAVVMSIGLAVWPSLPASWLPVLLFVLAMNAGGSTGDVLQTCWLLRFDSSVIFGCDGKNAAVYARVIKANTNT